MGISENESLIVQVLTIAVWIFALFVAFSIFDSFLPRLFFYIAITLCFWYFFKAVRGAPNVFKSKDDPITLADFFLSLIIGTITVLVIFNGLLIFNIDIRPNW